MLSFFIVIVVIVIVVYSLENKKKGHFTSIHRSHKPFLFVFSICETDVESSKLPNTRTQTLQITGRTCKYQILLLLSALLLF